MKHKLLDLNEKKQFRDIYHHFNIEVINDAYLNQSQVRGFFKEDKLVGGYLLNVNPSCMLYRQHIPADQQFLFQDIFSNAVELSCLWHCNSSDFSIYDRIRMHLQSLIDSLKTQKKIYYCWNNSA